MKLYVGNLSYQTTEQDLPELFSAHGQVTDARLILDRDTHRSRGFAFVTMSNEAEGRSAINALHGQALDGRDLTVNEARPMESRNGFQSNTRSPNKKLSGRRGSFGSYRS